MNDPQSENGWRHQDRCKKKTCIVALHTCEVWDTGSETFYVIPRACCVKCGWSFEMTVKPYQEVL